MAKTNLAIMPSPKDSDGDFGFDRKEADIFDEDVWPNVWRKQEKKYSQRRYFNVILTKQQHADAVRRIKLWAAYYMRRDAEYRPLFTTWLGKMLYTEDPPQEKSRNLFEGI